METLQRIPMSWEDYLATPEHPRHEWVDGMAIVMSASPHPDHQQAARRIANLLESSLPHLFVYEAINLRLTPTRVRVPDVVVLAEPATELFVDQVPVIVVEVLSPSTTTEDLMRKGPEYLRAGVRQYWVVDLRASEVIVFDNASGEWAEPRIVDAGSRGDVAVPGHGAVPVDVAAIVES